MFIDHVVAFFVILLFLSLRQTLDVKKEFPCPDIFNGVAQQVTDLFWVSTYVFAVVYTPLDPSDKTPFLVFLSAPVSLLPAASASHVCCSEHKI